MISNVVRIGFLFCLLVFPNMTSATASDAIFSNLMGSWSGKGILTPNLGGKKENIRCRLQNRESKTPGRMNVLGNCSVAGLLLPVNGWIKQSGTSKKYTAALFQSLTRLSSNNFSGRSSGKKLVLSYLGKDKDTKQPIKASITILSGGAKKFKLLIRREDPKSKKDFAVGTINFAKR